MRSPYHGHNSGFFSSLAFAQSSGSSGKAALTTTGTPITERDLTSVEVPKPEIRAKGDPDGSLTGIVSDIAVSDSKKGLTIADVLNQIGQNKIAINFVWTLITGFLVMFMQAGLAIVETGLCRANKCQPHDDDEFHGVRSWNAGMLADWVQSANGGCGRNCEPGRHRAA